MMGKTLFLTTDLGRWYKNTTQVPAWDERNIIIAQFIPDCSKVLDLGAGAQTLRRHLGVNCYYVPCDLVKSSPDCVVCNFNAGIYPHFDQSFDFVVCSGVLEYIRDPTKFLLNIVEYGEYFLLSYQTHTGDTAKKINRLAQGWVNHLRREHLQILFQQAGYGYEVIAEWRGQQIYRLWHK